MGAPALTNTSDNPGCELNNCPIHYELHIEQNIVVSQVRGAITFGDMLRHVNILAHDPAYNPSMKSYYDLTDCTNIEGNLADLSNFTQGLRNNEQDLPSSKTALILPDQNEKLINLVKGIVLMTSNSRIEHRYFCYSQRHHAYHFLDIDRDFLESKTECPSK